VKDQSYEVVCTHSSKTDDGR